MSYPPNKKPCDDGPGAYAAVTCRNCNASIEAHFDGGQCLFAPQSSLLLGPSEAWLKDAYEIPGSMAWEHRTYPERGSVRTASTWTPGPSTDEEI